MSQLKAALGKRTDKEVIDVVLQTFPSLATLTQKEAIADVARLILGLGTSPSRDQINRAAQELKNEYDPKNYPAGSPAQSLANQISQYIEGAQSRLREMEELKMKREWN